MFSQYYTIEHSGTANSGRKYLIQHFFDTVWIGTRLAASQAYRGLSPCWIALKGIRNVFYATTNPTGSYNWANLLHIGAPKTRTQYWWWTCPNRERRRRRQREGAGVTCCNNRLQRQHENTADEALRRRISNAPSLRSIHRTVSPLRHPWKADPVRDGYDNVWTEEEGKSLNEFHLEKQAWKFAPRGEDLSHGRRAATRLQDRTETLLSLMHNTRVRAKGFSLSVVTVAAMLGVVFHSGPGVPAVLALSWPVGLRVPSPHRVSTSNSWRSLSTAKVGGMLWTTSGAGPILKHISRLNNLWGGGTKTDRFIIGRALSPSHPQHL